MTTHCFTSITLRYLAKARVLGESVRRHHPDWRLHVVVSEPLPDWFDIAAEPFDDAIGLEDLSIPGLAGWVFTHTVVEVCTGVKGSVMDRLLARDDAEHVVYLDPDMVLFASLDDVERALEAASIVLTPHQLVPESTPRGVIDNEMTSLVHGIYNLGFIAVRADAQGKAFAAWWRDRLVDHCFDDRMAGLFTDQRWCDFVPAFFDRTEILRNPAYNVGPWNVSQRDVTKHADGRVLVNGEPLALFHFSGHDGGGGREMLARYAPPGSAVHELWDDYDRDVAARDEPRAATEWTYAHFDDGTPIEQVMRDAYRYRPDVWERFPDPFYVGDDDECFLHWWAETGREQWANR